MWKIFRKMSSIYYTKNVGRYEIRVDLGAQNDEKEHLAHNYLKVECSYKVDIMKTFDL